MKSTSILAIVATTSFLLVPAAHAGEEEQFHPVYECIMVGTNLPADKDLEGGSEFFFVWGFMVNPYFGYQVNFGEAVVSTDEIDGAGFYELAVSFKLAVPVAFVEPYVLGGAGLGVGEGGLGFPLHAAIGFDFNFGKVLVGAEARQVWLTVDGRDLSALLVMSKFGLRF